MEVNVVLVIFRVNPLKPSMKGVSRCSVFSLLLCLDCKPSSSAMGPLSRFEICEFQVLEAHKECKQMFDKIR